MYPRLEPHIETIKCTWKLNTTERSPHTSEKFCPFPKKIMENVLDAIGNTPLIRLSNISKEDNLKCELLAKCEFFNAGGSIKDRIGKRMLTDAEKSRRI